MPRHDEIQDADFDSQLQGLFHEAEQRIEDRVAATRRVEDEKESVRVAEERKETARVAEQRPALSLPQVLRPVVLGLEAVSRAAGENTAILTRLDKAAGEVADAQKALPQIVQSLAALLDQKNGVNMRMFDALHEELKGYKDGFLLESVHKPIIRDLISLYDDLTTIHRQMQEAVIEAARAAEGSGAALLQRLKTMDMNVEHNCEFILEVLARLEVSLMPVSKGKLDKHSQRAVAVEIAEDPDEDGDIIKSVKRGFLWKERVVRAEEVVIKKWKEGFLVALAPPVSQK